MKPSSASPWQALKCLHDLDHIHPQPITDVAYDLGALAPWILSPAALACIEDRPLRQACCDYQPSVRLGPQGIGILLRWCERDGTAHPAILPAWCLPLTWGDVADPHLPPGLGSAARDVRKVLAIDGAELRLHPDLAGLDLSDFDLSYDSAWLPLALALWARTKGNSLNSSTLATGAHRHTAAGHLLSADGIEEKAVWARTRGFKRLIVPASNVVCEGFNTTLIPPLACDPTTLLRPALTWALETPDPDVHDLDTCCDWADLLVGKERENYLVETINPRLAERLRIAVDDRAQVPHPCALVITYSRNSSFDLALRILQPDRVLVVTTRRFAGDLHTFCAQRRDGTLDAIIGDDDWFGSDEAMREMTRRIRQLTAGTDLPLVADVTGAWTLLSVQVAIACHGLGGCVGQIRSDTTPFHRCQTQRWVRIALDAS